MILTVLGRRGCGKSTQIKARVRKLSRVLIFDTLAEYGDLGTVVMTPLDLVKALESKQHTFFRIVLQPIDCELDSAFEYFMRAAWIAGDCVVVIDEIDQVASPLSRPFELEKNLRYGRHRSIGMIAASRRAAEIPRLLTSQSDEIVLFNMTEPRDVSYIADCCGPEYALAVRTLPRYRYLLYRPFDANAVTTYDSREVVERSRATREQTPLDTEPAPMVDNAGESVDGDTVAPLAD